jgi:hypothetical protein
MLITSKPEYALFILQALSNLSNATLDELMERTFNLIEDRLYPADYKLLPNGVLRWRNQSEFMLESLIENDYIEKYGEKYVLTSKGLSYLEKYYTPL